MHELIKAKNFQPFNKYFWSAQKTWKQVEKEI